MYLSGSLEEKNESKWGGGNYKNKGENLLWVEDKIGTDEWPTMFRKMSKNNDI